MLTLLIEWGKLSNRHFHDLGSAYCEQQLKLLLVTIPYVLEFLCKLTIGKRFRKEYHQQGIFAKPVWLPFIDKG